MTDAVALIVLRYCVTFSCYGTEDDWEYKKRDCVTALAPVRIVRYEGEVRSPLLTIHSDFVH